MKKLAFILLLALAVSCNNDAAPKPEHLLKEKEMVDIFYDINLLQAIKSTNLKALEDNNVDVKNYIYKKYKIDSLTFAQNHTYYASDLKKYQKIQLEASARLTKTKDKISPPKKAPAKGAAAVKGTAQPNPLNSASHQ